MNKAKLKSYAPQARKDFIAAVTSRANLLGISSRSGHLEIEVSEPQGEVTVIAGQPWPIKVQAQREQLVKRIRKDGFEHTMDAVAYTWFNRFAALRYMELHDYLGHGHRALSSAEGTLPDLLTHAAELANSGALPGLNAELVTEMKLTGNRDGELYRMLLVAQCNALSTAMPFLFERIDDDSELLLPDNLLLTDSVIAKLFEAISEEDWQEIEIIGWLYQFYISEKKDQVIGKVVKSEDIPAATQLFTPNWIVQYLVQNSVGRLWLMANPQSTLASEWPYYIQPAEQTPEVQAQLDALVQTRIAEDSPDVQGVPASPRPLGEGLGVRAGGTLNPETITVLDPACGSGHILVVAYDVLKSIYLERGYRLRDIPRLILEKNLYGLDIDDRAAQMAGFALLMKARADDRRLFTATDEAGNLQPPKLNVLALQSSEGLNPETIAQALATALTSVLLPPPAGEGWGGGVSQVNDFAPSDLFPETRPQMTLGEDVQSQVARGVAQWGSDPNSGQGSRGNQSGTTDLGSDPHWAGQTTTSLQATIATLIQTFEHAKTFGSLIQIPTSLKQQLPALVQMLPLIQQTGDLYSSAAADSLLPLVQQAQVMAMQFDVVVANPPYMGGKGMNPALKNFAKAIFPDSKSDLFAMFMERGFEWCKPSGFNSMVTMQSWMFLSSYEAMRVKLLKDRTIQTMAHLGARAFGEISGEVVQTTAFILQGQHFSGFKPVFIRLVEGQEDDKQTALRTRKHRFETTAQDEFRKITGSPVAYWVSEQLRATFSDGTILRATADVKQGLATGNNDRFMRFWAEVPLVRTGLNFDSREQARNSGKKWFPYSKGGEFRKWYGNREWLVNWANDGEEVRGFCDVAGNVLSRPRAGDYYFRESVTWTLISNTTTAFRFEPKGNVISHKGPGIFAESDQLLILLAFLNSRVSETLLKILAPSMSFEIGQVAQLPVLRIDGVNIEPVRIAREDWDSIEVSWDFQKLPWIVMSPIPLKMSDDWHKWLKICIDRIAYIKAIEEQNNRLFIAAYGLQSELSPEVPESQITLARADREKDCQRLISYAIGCMMGRYSLDEPGLIYAHAGNIGFDPSRYSKFPADADGIIPITDELWFEDDAAERVREFVRVVWGASPHPNPPPGGEGATAEASPAATVTTGGLEANMTWLAESLGTKASETPDETIRRYIADKFFKDHLQTYKKRPIYWLFSSGKHSAFQALVYLHRYHEGTLSRLRAEYVVPLTGKIQGRIEMLQKDAAAASSTAARNKLAKEVEKLKKKHVELLAYDEQLRHYADMRITLDLDDGVKVNYGKFGDLLDSVKIVTGGANDD